MLTLRLENSSEKRINASSFKKFPGLHLNQRELFLSPNPPTVKLAKFESYHLSPPVHLRSRGTNEKHARAKGQTRGRSKKSTNSNSKQVKPKEGGRSKLCFICNHAVSIIKKPAKDECLENQGHFIFRKCFLASHSSSSHTISSD